MFVAFCCSKLQSKSDVMASKKKVAKLFLKTSKTTTLDDPSKEMKKAIDGAVAIKGSTSLTFKTMVNNLSVDDLSSLKDFINHDKSVMEKKLLALSSFSSTVKDIERVRDFLNEALTRASELVHDNVIEEASNKGKKVKDFLMHVIDVRLDGFEDQKMT